MSLSKKIAAALDENTKVHVPPCAVTVEDGPDRADLAPLGPRFGRRGVHARWSSPRRAGPSGRRRRSDDWGERLAGRVTYLMEPLKVFEIDAGGGEVQIRSQSPTARADQRGYYEIRLFKQGSLDGTLRVRRDDSTSVGGSPASSPARYWNAWPTTSPPASADGSADYARRPRRPSPQATTPNEAIIGHAPHGNEGRVYMAPPQTLRDPTPLTIPSTAAGSEREASDQTIPEDPPLSHAIISCVLLKNRRSVASRRADNRERKQPRLDSRDFLARRRQTYRFFREPTLSARRRLSCSRTRDRPLFKEYDRLMHFLSKPYVHLPIDAVDTVILDPMVCLDRELYDHYGTFKEARDAALSSIEVMLDEEDYDGEDHREELERMHGLLEAFGIYEELEGQPHQRLLSNGSIRPGRPRPETERR